MKTPALHDIITYWKENCVTCMLDSVQATMVVHLRQMRKQFCWRSRSDIMRKAQLQLGKRYLRRGTEVKKHGNVASFHLASRCIHSNLRRKG